MDADKYALFGTGYNLDHGSLPVVFRSVLLGWSWTGYTFTIATWARSWKDTLFHLDYIDLGHIIILLQYILRCTAIAPTV